MKFLNIDFEITSRRRPVAILSDFADRVLVMHDGKMAGAYFTTFELSYSAKTEKRVFAGFISLLAGLSKEGKAELAKARVKRFDVGYLKAKNERIEHSFPSEILRAISDLGCELAFTVYQEENQRSNQTVHPTTL
ncbi:MAG: hypothetical protein IPL39_11845 [Opitutaceae bacterium]|nr:hypothetical protein [Opitutaceae bacterium]